MLITTKAKITISATLFGLLAMTIGNPSPVGFEPRNCDPNALVCNGATQFGICSMNTTGVWVTVVYGTKYVCSCSICTITASSTGHENLPPTSYLNFSENYQQQTGSFYSTQAMHGSLQLVPGLSPMFTTAVVVRSTSGSRISSPTPKSSVVVISQPSLSSSRPNQNLGSASGTGKSYINVFFSNGEPPQGWPQQFVWVDFESIWSLNLQNFIYKSCETFRQINNSEQESTNLEFSVQSVAKSSGVDECFILVIALQESGGCVRAPTTKNGVINPGVMQSHDGAHSCYSIREWPWTQVIRMIQDGTIGTSSGQGLQQVVAAEGRRVDRYYKTARIYNSGSRAATGLLQDGIATHCYASDIANRLVGWSEAANSCKLN